MKTLSELFAANRAWAAQRTLHDPRFFQRLSEGQSPGYLWIGCADSRVPPNEIVGLHPGELFVHRNVANVVDPGDENAMSVLQYAVEALGIDHVIVCGHYGCGGVQAALGSQTEGPLDRWIDRVRSVARAHEEELRDLEPEARWRLLCELNVRAQTAHVRATRVVRDAMDAGRKIHVHGWVYSLEDGRLQDLELDRDQEVASGPDGTASSSDSIQDA